MKRTKHKINKKKTKRKTGNGLMMLLLSSLAALSIIACLCLTDSQKTAGDVHVSVESVFEPPSVDLESLLSQNHISVTDATPAASYPSSYYMEIPFINQMPELPTGCEITSLAEVLSYLGYDIDKEDLARNYLSMSHVKTAGCYINYFLGSPWDANGSGCFAPAIASAANQFFSDHGSEYSARVISYSSVENLFYELSLGHPIIVWTSYNYQKKQMNYTEVDLGSGNYFSWPDNEHCVVLSGYDLDKSTVRLADPTYGIVERSIEDFTYFYQMYFYQAVVIY